MVERAEGLVGRERLLAEAEARRAEKDEALADGGNEWHREIHKRAAAIHRAAEQVHRRAAELHGAHAIEHSKWAPSPT
jgi:hypothetical protein